MSWSSYRREIFERASMSRILTLYLTCTLFSISRVWSDECPSQQNEIQPTEAKNFTVNGQLSYLTFHPVTGDVFVAGYNEIHRLSSDLNVIQTYKYPENENNSIKLMLTDNEHNALVVCGTSHNGQCYRHNLEDITENVTLLNGIDKSSGYITSLTGSTVGIIAPQKTLSGQWENVFYFARTLDEGLPHTDQQSVSSKKWNSNMDGFQLVTNETRENVGIYSEMTVAEEYLSSYKIEYLYSFTHNGFTYFVTRQRKSVRNPNLYEIRLVRLCQNDVGFHSYMELTLACKSSRLLKGKFRNPIDAFLGNVTTDFQARSKFDSDTVLFVLCSRTDDDDNEGVTNGYIVCPYLMSKVEKAFYDGIVACKNQASYRPGLEFFYGDSPRQLCIFSGWEVSVCPNTTYHLHVNKILSSKNILTNSANEDIIFPSPPTSIAVTIYGDHTLLVVGTEMGNIEIYHIGAFEVLGTPVISLKLSDNAMSSHIEVRNEVIYTTTNSSVFKKPIKDTCQYIRTCRECLVKKYLQCGFCTGYGCMSESDCSHHNSTWSRTHCPPIVTSISPLTGPLEGGTQITICGEALGHTTANLNPTIRHVSLEDVANCTVTNEENYGQLICSTETNSSIIESRKIITAPITLRILAEMPPKSYEFDAFEINETLKIGSFSFFPVKVKGTSPHKGPDNGGTVLTVEGQHLDVGKDVSVKIGKAPCDIFHRSEREIRCKTSPKNGAVVLKTGKAELVDDFDAVLKTLKPSAVTVKIDNFDAVSPDEYQYMPNPDLIDLMNKRLKSIKSAGIHILIPGTNLESVANPYATVDIKDVGSINVTCTVVRGPKNQAQYLQFITPSVPKKLIVLVTFVLDSLIVKKRMSIIPDPVIHRNTMTQQNEDLEISIQGDNIDHVCQDYLSPYKRCDVLVFVGDLKCPENKVEVSERLITCRVNRSVLEKDSDEKYRNVTVQFGLNLRLSAGMIDLSPPSHAGIIGGAVAAVIIALLLIVVVIVLKKRSSKKRANSVPPVVYNRQESNQQHNTYFGSRHENGERSPLLSVGSYREHLPSDLLSEMSPLLIEPTDLVYSRNDTIGKGNFGIVFHGLYYPKNEEGEKDEEVKVAIKTMSKIESISAVEQFLREALIMRDFDHPHVLTLIGVLMDENSCPMVVLPFMKHGDLLMFIRNPDNRPTVKDLVGFGLQACKGMQYLSSHRFVHRDLAARNCMLDEDYTVKVADFGLARDIYEKEYYKPHDRVGRMPVKWMALESLLQQKFNMSTDVWSFGVLMWELITRGVTPYPDVDAFDVCQYLLDGRRLKQPEFCSDELYELLLRCWSPHSEDRPNFNELVDLLSEIHKNIHGVHYPGLDVTYVNLDVHPYPSRLRTNESSSTGGSDVFSPGLHSPPVAKPAPGPPPPPRNPMPSNDGVFSPSTPLLGADEQNSNVHIPQDEQGYLLPSVSQTPKGAHGADTPTFGRLRNGDNEEDQKQLVMHVSEESVEAPNNSAPPSNSSVNDGGNYVNEFPQAAAVGNGGHLTQEHRSSPIRPHQPSIKDLKSFVVPPSPLQSRPAVLPKPAYMNETQGARKPIAHPQGSRYHNISRDSPDFLSNPTYVLHDVQPVKESKEVKDTERQRNRNNGNNTEERYVSNPGVEAATHPAYVELPKK